MHRSALKIPTDASSRYRFVAPFFYGLMMLCFSFSELTAQVTTTGFANAVRLEAPGTLLSHPIANGSEPIGRTTSLNYLNGWIIVGGEAPGSRPGSDLVLRVYDISDPTNPIARVPSDFNLSYSNNRWHQGNVGWNAHGTAQTNGLLLPQVMRVDTFGGIIELGGTNGIPNLGQVGVGYNRSSQAGPWVASFPWYGSADADFTIQRVSNDIGYNQFQTLATFDHVGQYGGGDWHPIFFGDLLIYARSGSSANDGIVVYRLQYNNYDDPENRSVTPQFVGSLPGGFEGYWPNLFSDGSGLYVIGSSTDILLAADITQAVDPAGDGSVSLVSSLTVPGFTNASYPVYQDNFGFIHNRKVDMTRFIAGDANPIELTLNEGAPNNVNTSQMSLALGNLWITGGYPIGFGTANYDAQGMGVWVHQQAPDTTAPRVSYHIPQTGRTNYPRHAPLSFLIHEHSRAGGPRNGIDFMVRPVLPDDSLGSLVPGYLIHDFSGTLTFTPSAGLDPDTTYQVDFPSDVSDPQNLIGFIDAADNAIEAYSFRFSTGGGLNATPPPVFTSISADDHQPAPGEQITVTASATGTGPFDYRFNFDGTWTSWATNTSESHTYATEGRPRVLVQVRDSAEGITNGSLRLLVIDAPPAGPRPTHSSTMAIGDDPSGRRLWVVNPDSDTVSVLNASTGAKVDEHSTGSNSSPRSITRDSAGRYWITCQDSDEIRILNPDGSLSNSISLDYGSAPFGISATPDGQSIFVTLYGSEELHRYATASPTAAPTIGATFPTPRAIAISADGSRVFVTRFISPELSGEVAEFSGTTLNLTRTISLSSANTIDGGDRSAGTPNYLTSIVISPDGTTAAVASKQDNIQRGLLYGVDDLTHETSVRAVVSFIDLVANQEIRDTRRDIDNSDSPSALAYTPLGDTLLVSLQGNNTIVGLDALSLAPVPGFNVSGSTLSSPAVINLELSTGLAPQGLLLDSQTNRLFAQNFMDRSVTVRDASPLLVENKTNLPLTATTSTVTSETLTSDVLLGKQVFYNAADPRMSAESYISCATCHLDGGHDGRIWDFTGRGEGLRRTTDLRGRSGLGHGNVHWSANFDEIQDFEHDIRGPFGGTGFLPLTPGEFSTFHASPATGKTGLSTDLDALAAYVASLTPDTTPRSHHRQSDGSLTAAALRGRDVFTAESCATCHSGPSQTNSILSSVSTPSLEQAGTLSLLSGQRLGGTLTGIDTPTLHGLHAARSYLHHGQASSVEDSLSYTGGTILLPSEALLVGLSENDVSSDTPNQGGGGFTRGALGGSTIEVRGATTNGVRFSNVDGGASGGTARISMRYVKKYGNSTASIRINQNTGSDQSLSLLRQTPDNGWMTSGWRWITVEANLLPGASNTIEIFRGNADFVFDALLVSNSSDLAVANPHRRVLALSSGDHDDLIEYLLQLDGRDDSGTPLAPPSPPAATAPTIVTPPSPTTLAVGNSLSLSVSVTGTGPFQYQWFRGITPVGTDSQLLSIPSVSPSDSGSYTVQITNSVGQVTSPPVSVTVNPALDITTTSLPTLTVGRSYDIDLEASGGLGVRSWSISGSNLPAGLTLSAQGSLSGTPTAPAHATVVFQVTDSSGSTSRPIPIIVRPIGGFISDPDLILHYTFDEGNGIRAWDAATQGNDHSTDISEAQWVNDGRFGGAYGASDLNTTLPRFFPANQQDLNFAPNSEPFTISLWVRTTTTDSYRTLLGKDGNAAENWRVQYRLWAVNPVTNIQGISGAGWSGQLSTNLNDGQWHLLTMVNYLDGGTWRSRVYLNDGSTYTQWNTGNGAPVPQQLRIGDTSHGGNGWNGQIDDLRIYQRALSQSEVATLYSPPAAPLNYDTWLNSLPTSVPADQRSILADPDSDGMVNLVEYALDGNPMSGVLQNLPAVSIVQPSNSVAQFSYLRARADITYTVETSTELTSDSWTTVGVTQDTSSPVGSMTTATMNIDQTSCRFFRLLVTEN